MRIVLALFALLLLAGVAILVVAYFEESEPADEQAVYDEDEEPEPNDEPADAPPVVDDDDDPRRVPRVLPPDAALEDIRDALAANDVDALQAAYEQLGRLAASKGRVRTALRNQIASMADADVRAIAIAAIGQSRDDDNEEWLVSVLTDRRAALTDRTSALVALATALEPSDENFKMRHGAVVVPLTAINESHASAIRSFLDEPGSSSRSAMLGTTSAESVALALIRSTLDSAVYARMIVTDDGRRRAHLRELTDTHWKLLRETAASCEDLDDQTKDKIAKVE